MCTAETYYTVTCHAAYDHNGRHVEAGASWHCTEWQSAIGIQQHIEYRQGLPATLAVHREHAIDTAPLIALRTMIRRAYTGAAALPQTVEVRETRTRLDAMCAELGVEIDAAEPELMLRRAA